MKAIYCNKPVTILGYCPAPGGGHGTRPTALAIIAKEGGWLDAVEVDFLRLAEPGDEAISQVVVRSYDQSLLDIE